MTIRAVLGTTSFALATVLAAAPGGTGPVLRFGAPAHAYCKGWNNDINNAKRDHDNHSGRANSLQGQINSANGQVTQVRNEVTSLTTQVADLEKLVNNLKQQVLSSGNASAAQQQQLRAQLQQAQASSAGETNKRKAAAAALKQKKASALALAPKLLQASEAAYASIKEDRKKALEASKTLWEAAKSIDEAGPEMQKKLVQAANAFWEDLKNSFDLLSKVRPFMRDRLTIDPADTCDTSRAVDLAGIYSSEGALKTEVDNASGGAIGKVSSVLEGVGSKVLSAAFEKAKEAVAHAARLGEGYIKAATKVSGAKNQKAMDQFMSQYAEGIKKAVGGTGLDGIVKTIVEIQEGQAGKDAEPPKE